MNFASPPAVPISPASYPNSPESTRYSPAFQAVQASYPAPVDYHEALNTDPFQAEASSDEDNEVIAQALENAKTNASITTPEIKKNERYKEDAVKDTLSRFASAPRRNNFKDSENVPQDQGQPSKSAMDVDAFKRLLLTGNSGTSTPKGSVAHSLQPPTFQSKSESSSSIDTASLSQKSLFESVPRPIEESPRSSYESDAKEVEFERPAISNNASQEGRKKPIPPKTRHGKLIGDSSNATGDGQIIPYNAEVKTSSEFASNVDNVSSSSSALYATSTAPHSAEAAMSESAKKKPPTPPLARRKSQNNTPRPLVTRNSYTRQTLSNIDSDAPPSPSSTSSASRIPPPPPSRRPNSFSDRRISNDLPAFVEENENALSSVESRTDMSSAKKSSGNHRLSQTSSGAPPLPPPRKNRGSSRSSVDSQRPSLSGLGIGPPISTDDGNQPLHAEAQINAGNTYANDILADLAALQREVDAARANSG